MPPIMIVVLMTAPSMEKALEIARAVVDARLAACVNVLGEVRSIYRWQGAVKDDAEVLCVMKTTVERFEALKAKVLALHPYDLPELIALPVALGHAPYLAWVSDSVA